MLKQKKNIYIYIYLLQKKKRVQAHAAQEGPKYRGQ